MVGSARGAALSRLRKMQYQGADTTSMDVFLRDGKKVTLLPGQTRTEIAPVETSKFEQQLSRCKGKYKKKQANQHKYLRRVASFYFSTFSWSSGHVVISDAVADLVAVGAVPEPWLKADGTPVDSQDFPGFRRIGKVAKQDAADDNNNEKHKTKIKKLGKRERNSTFSKRR